MRNNLALALIASAPMLAVTPTIFVNRSSTPKMLLILAGLCLLSTGGIRRKAAAHFQARAFFFACLVSWCFAVSKWTAFAGMQLAPYYGLFGVALVIAAYLAATEGDDSLIKILEVTGVIVGAFAISQWFYQSSFVGMPMQGGRASGFRGSPVMFAASLIPCLMASWHLARERKSAWLFPSFAPTIIIILGMAAAKAKGALFASAVGLWVYETGGMLRWAGVAASWVIIHAYVFNATDANSRERVELINIAYTAFKQRPFFGWGPDNFIYALERNRTATYTAIVGATSQASAHWDIAQIAATLGITGLGAYLWTLWALFRAEYIDDLAVSVLAAIVIQAQVNPIPTDILVVVALILGSRQKSVYGYWQMPSWIIPALAGASVTIAVRDLRI